MTTTLSPNPKFTEWASSFGGMDGGNLTAPLWVCDLDVYANEGSLRPFTIADEFSYVMDGLRVPCIDIQREDRLDNALNRRVAKLSACILTGKMEGWEQFIKKEIAAQEGQVFKMTLYPLNFPDSSDDWWAEEHYAKTGFRHKIEYKTWCIQHRFPFLRSLIERHQPKAVICTSKEANLEYRIAFIDVDNLYNQHYFRNSFNINMHHIDQFTCFNGSTQAFVAPLVGTKHLLEDSDISVLAEHIVAATEQ